MYGIIDVNKDKFVFGDFPDTKYAVYILCKNGDTHIAKNYEIVKDYVTFSTKYGYYILNKEYSAQDLEFHKQLKGKDLFPYTFPKNYEAVNNFKLFVGAEICTIKNVYKYADKLKYTFGLEFESSMGCLPEHRCFIDGLIPLRDGSITGPEFSTIVLKNNAGICLIQQQLEDLRRYTSYNKECSLHMHFGKYPVNRKAIFTLYSLCYLMEPIFKALSNEYIFNTEKYKASRKSYCQKLPYYESFERMFEDIVETNFAGSYTDPHPKDVEHARKWQIHGRYKWVNFVNMLCYKNPKTVEFRFLRPTYNFTKIYTWILIFNAVLNFAEYLTETFGECSPATLASIVETQRVSLNMQYILEHTYGECSDLLEQVCLLECISQLQTTNGDYAGNDTSFENELLSYDYLKRIP